MADADRFSVEALAFVPEKSRAEREVLRSASNPSVDYAELLFSKAFGWQLQNNSSVGYDA